MRALDVEMDQHCQGKMACFNTTTSKSNVSLSSHASLPSTLAKILSSQITAGSRPLYLRWKRNCPPLVIYVIIHGAGLELHLHFPRVGKIIQVRSLGFVHGSVGINRRLLPSALAEIDRRLLLGSTVGSCWDRPPAFAGIDRKLQGELC
jgi:hypothetical protein